MRRLLLLSLLIASACTTSPGGAPFQDREWTLTSVEGISSLPAGPAPTLRFGSDGRVSGNSGCNMAGADYTVDGGRLNIAALMMTKRACAEQSRNELEAAFVAAVQSARSFRITDGTLELLDESGQVVARFS
jgi:heat shock protein HslJ